MDYTTIVDNLHNPCYSGAVSCPHKSCSGIGIGLIQMLLFLLFSFGFQESYPTLKSINFISYYWLMFTILTGIWEICFIVNYNKVITLANKFLKNNEHVWTNKYNLSYLFPNKLSKIFYAEYGAYGDREYMLRKDFWSRIVEGTHCDFAGFFSLSCIYCKIYNRENEFIVTTSIAMASQLMNSILYMANYFEQMKDPDNVNYITSKFPAGFALCKRPFMYVNLAWTFMPIYTICWLLISYYNENV